VRLVGWRALRFTDSVTAYYGAPERVEGLGFLPWSFTAHFDSEPERRDEFHRLLTKEAMPSGFAADDGAALHFRGLALHKVVSSRPSASAASLNCRSGGVFERRLEAEYLGAPSRREAVVAEATEKMSEAAKAVVDAVPLGPRAAPAR
jgi:hypothetical protein